MKRGLFYWAPAALWAAVVLAASSEPLAAEHTGQWLQDVVVFIAGRPLSPEAFAITHYVIRKLAHLTEYGIFGALMFRALRSDERGWSVRSAIGAVIAAALLAAVDEWHQTFVPGRTGAAGDVLIDICGATIAQLLRYSR